MYLPSNFQTNSYILMDFARSPVSAVPAFFVGRAPSRLYVLSSSSSSAAAAAPLPALHAPPVDAPTTYKRVEGSTYERAEGSKVPGVL
jgi:hypothetical protein